MLKTRLKITKPDDWHLHLRDGACMRSVIGHTAQHFSRAIVMPNLVPPVTTVRLALDYKKRIVDALPEGSTFNPLMTLYLTNTTTPDEVVRAKEAGIIAFKLYPAGATTNSAAGVRDFDTILPVFHEMAKVGILLLVHGEVTDSHVDVFDREAVFIHSKLSPLLEKVPNLKVVLEHITTSDSVDFVLSCPHNVAATITPQHMYLNRNAMFRGGLRPHNYCLPILKKESHRAAVLRAATSGNPKFFLGTDSAPHAKHLKESSCGCAGIYNAPVALALYTTMFEEANALDKLEAFASFNGPDFYGLPRNSETLTLIKEPWTVPNSYEYGGQGEDDSQSTVIPMCAGETINWQVEEDMITQGKA